jgi:hypothetical protein
MSTPETERNKDIFRRFTDGMNTNDAEIISRTIDELVEPEAVIRTPLHALGEAVAADGRADG